MQAVLGDFSTTREPQSLCEALSSGEAENWKKAADEEYESLLENETWTLKPLPPGRTAIKCKWIFKIKSGQGTAEGRFKARLVAKGFTQRKEIDYKETFAPVAKHTSLRVLLAIASSRDLEMIQLDIKTAFLYGTVQEELYMEQPEGYINPQRPNDVCHLNKCIYGLKQAPRVWNLKFHDFFVKFGLTQSKADPCVYIRKNEEELTLVIIYVDDGIAFSNKKNVLVDITNFLSTEFKIRTMEVDRFLGLDIVRKREEKKIHVNQCHLIEKLLKRFGLEECKPRLVPADPCSRLSIQMCPKADSGEHLANPYREAVGGLMYLMVLSRPDIAFAVGEVSKFCKNPGPAHWNAVKRIYAYLSATRHHGICFDGRVETGLRGYSDADFAGDPDKKKSTTGYIFTFNGSPVSWASRRQKVTALSSTESELIATCETTKEAIWLKRLVSELGLTNPCPVTIHCDNQSTIKILNNPEQHQKTKHIDVKFYYAREKLEKGEINITYLRTEDQLADMFTKPLPRPRLEDMRKRIRIEQHE